MPSGAASDVRLLHISLLIQHDLAGAFDGTALTTSRVHCLWELSSSGPTTQATLASALEVTPRTVTSLVDALESSGYVERRPHPTDRRAVLVALTHVGQTTMATMAQERAQLAADLVGDLDAHETNLEIVFERDLTVRTTRGSEVVRRIALYADDPKAYLEEVRRHIG